MMERKAAETWIITTLLLMNFALMVNSSTGKTSENSHALNSLSTSFTPPFIEWNQTYGGTGDDVATSVVQTSPDGGYALAGYTNSSGAGFDDFYLVKAR